LYCNTEFIPKKSKTKYCSRKCYGEHKKNGIKVNCLLCGNEFLVAPNTLKDNRGKYCSRTCVNMSHRGTIKESSKIKLSCDYCGKDILIHPYKLKDRKYHFCSKECKNKYLSEHFSGENAFGFRDRTVIKKCEICNKEFKANLINVENGKDRFCSRKCSHEHMKTLCGDKSRKYKRYETTCPTCGKVLKLTKHRINDGSKNHFCSLSCRSAYTVKYCMPKQNTSIERAIKSVLDYLNITYEEQYIVSGFVVDFYLPDYNLLIECDGDYWHNRPEQIKRDNIRNAVFKKLGYNLLRLWEHDIKQDALGLITTNLNIV